ncbi:MAG TPA: ATP-grasp domain-containing protein [Steroidobacteraceae bacterium]|nr:ATP-grasp domain-containing protein [Steroidobacteraceae bacterium]
MTTVLILDAQQRSALAATRSLGRRGIKIYVADAAPTTLAGSSRFAYQQLRCPDPMDAPLRFVDWVKEVAATAKTDIVMPMTDQSSMLLAPVQHDISGKVACGEAQSYELISNKAKLMEIGAAAGIALPRTQLAHSIDELRQILANARFPVVLKPARSKILVGDRIVPTAVHIAQTSAEANLYARQQVWLGIEPCLVQEFIPGHGAGVFAFAHNGQTLAWFAHRRVREKPPQGGVSVLSESTPTNSNLIAASEKLLAAAKWTGPAMIEFRIADDGTPYLMEVNARLWGSLQLAVDCGVDFPWLMVESLTNTSIEGVRFYRQGRRLRWLLGDLDNLLIQLRQGPIRGSRAQAISEFLFTFLDPRTRQEIFRWNDPAPAWFELKSWLRSAL